MNLFVTSTDPVASAQALDDKRVGKMLMEANQLLSLSVHFHWKGHYIESIEDYVGEGMLCSAGRHMNHPCTIWVRASQSNFDWTVRHAYALGHEWTYRFDAFHGSSVRTQFIERFRDCLPSGPLIPFQNSARNKGLDLDFTHLPVPLSYQEYLKARWPNDKRSPSWTKRGSPSWVRQQ